MMHTDQSTEQPHSPRIVIVGGVAGGASAAARLRRLDEHASITLIERGADVSFANCGLPYHIGGEIEDRGKLSVQTPASLRAQLAIDVQARTEAISIDRETKTLRIHKLDTDVEEDLGYDKLILSPGATPLKLPLEGIDLPGIYIHCATYRTWIASRLPLNRPRASSSSELGSSVWKWLSSLSTCIKTSL